MIAKDEILAQRHAERGPGRRETVKVRRGSIVQIACDENDVALESSDSRHKPANRAKVPDVAEMNIAHKSRGAAAPCLGKVIELDGDAFNASCGRIDNSVGAKEQSSCQKDGRPGLPIRMQAYKRRPTVGEQYQAPRDT